MKFSCPTCAQSIQCADNLAGTKTNCQKCGQRILIPTPTVAISPLPTEWYYVRDGKQFGPFGEREINPAVGRGEIRPNDLVWRKGMVGWEPAASHFNFAPLLPSPAQEKSLGADTRTRFMARAKCSTDKQPTFSILFRMQPGIGWCAEKTYKRSDDGSNEEIYPAQPIHGRFQLDTRYPGCPYCGAMSLFQCGECNNLSCLHFTAEMKAEPVFSICPFCGKWGAPLATPVDRIDGASEM